MPSKPAGDNEYVCVWLATPIKRRLQEICHQKKTNVSALLREQIAIILGQDFVTLETLGTKISDLEYLARSINDFAEATKERFDDSQIGLEAMTEYRKKNDSRLEKITLDVRELQSATRKLIKNNGK